MEIPPPPKKMYKPFRSVQEVHLVKYLQMSEDYPHLECDGFSNVLAFEMREDGYEPKILRGVAAYKGKRLPIHYWIEIDNQTIDYRLRMWFGEDAPHGLIEDLDVEYFWKYEMEIPPKSVIDFLKIKVDARLIGYVHVT